MVSSVANWSYCFNDLKDSDTVPLLYEDKLGSIKSWFDGKSILFRHKKGISIPDVYSHSNESYYLGETRTSVGTAIMCAHVMGCSPIYLIGVDCCRFNGLRYFWQHRNFKDEKPYRNDGIPVDRYRKCKSSNGITDYDLVDISRTWDSFAKEANKKCIVYNLSKISILKCFERKNVDGII